MKGAYRCRVRTNLGGSDLSQNFDDFFSQNNDRLEPETDAVQEWSKTLPFAVGLSLRTHDRYFVAYPYFNNGKNMIESDA